MLIKSIQDVIETLRVKLKHFNKADFAFRYLIKGSSLSDSTVSPNAIIVRYEDKYSPGFHMEEIFPADHRGNYFYFRFIGEVEMDYDSKYNYASCGGDGYQIVVPLFAVFDMQNADIDKLDNYIRTFINDIPTLKVKAIEFNPQVVIAEEMFTDETSKNIKDRTILRYRLEYTYTPTFLTNTECEEYELLDPCKTC